MVIINVNRSKEKAMLNTVSVLRRLLRNAFLVTNRVSVMGVLQKGQGTEGLVRLPPGPARIDEVARDRQPKIRFVGYAKCLAPQNPFFLCAFNTVAASPPRQVEIVIGLR